MQENYTQLVRKADKTAAVKRTVVFFLFLILFSNKLLAKDTSAAQIKNGSRFMMMGNVELRESPDFEQPVKYKTLNHENGFKVLVLEIGKEDFFQNKKGRWYHVLTTASLWVDNGDWIKKHTKFWIFITDNTELFDFEE